jgi:hypothetical protein
MHRFDGLGEDSAGCPDYWVKENSERDSVASWDASLFLQSPAVIGEHHHAHLRSRKSAVRE